MNQTFARRYRLTKTDEFSSVFGFRRAIKGEMLMLHYFPGPEALTPRLGVVVGKKFLKKAVDRNVFKRVIREQFRQHKMSLPALDLVVRLFVKPKTLNRKKIALECLSLFNRLERQKRKA